MATPLGYTVEESIERLRMPVMDRLWRMGTQCPHIPEILGALWATNTRFVVHGELAVALQGGPNVPTLVDVVVHPDDVARLDEAHLSLEARFGSTFDFEQLLDSNPREPFDRWPTVEGTPTWATANNHYYSHALEMGPKLRAAVGLEVWRTPPSPGLRGYAALKAHQPEPPRTPKRHSMDYEELRSFSDEIYVGRFPVAVLRATTAARVAKEQIDYMPQRLEMSEGQRTYETGILEQVVEGDKVLGQAKKELARLDRG